MKDKQFSTIISTDDLHIHYRSKSWILVDCRLDLLKPDWGLQNYLDAHIRGSIYVDVNKDLSGPITPLTGRHPLPDPAQFVNRVSAWGIQPGKQVIAIDTSGGAFAARIWWMLRAIGHNQVAVLDGGFTKWVHEQRPVKSGKEPTKPTEFTYPATFTIQPMVHSKEIADPHFRLTHVLLDARAPERYRGEIEPIDSVAGHIPGAINRPTAANLQEDGSFKPEVILRDEFMNLLQDTPPEQVVTYCGSGVTACQNLLALELAGLPGAALYPGSWSEWIRDADRPIEKGEAKHRM